jgi:hypothetical protein
MGDFQERVKSGRLSSRGQSELFSGITRQPSYTFPDLMGDTAVSFFHTSTLLFSQEYSLLLQKVFQNLLKN